MDYFFDWELLDWGKDSYWNHQNVLYRTHVIIISLFTEIT